MMLPRNILVPTDYSEMSETAIDYAVSLAAKLDARVHLLHVIPIPFAGHELGLAVTDTVLDGLVRGNQTALLRLADRWRGKAQFADVVLHTGDARDMILQTVNDVKADLIVMGTHGRRGISRALMGSVAESIVRLAPCPVLTVRTKVMPS